MLKKSLLIIDPAGLHARPVSILTAEAIKHKSKIEIEFDNRKANLKSILSVMGLGVTPDSKIMIYVDGEDEETALSGLMEAFKVNKLAM